MSSQDVPIQFREMLAAKSLAWDSSDNVSSHFYFDLNNGPIYARRDPESVMQIIQIGYDLLPDKLFGEWSLLLDLVAVRSELNDKHVVWHRPYHIRDSDNPDQWISLRSWLTEQGQNIDSYLAANQ